MFCFLIKVFLTKKNIMKRKKFNGKLSLNKEIISKLDSSKIKGGWITSPNPGSPNQPACDTSEYESCEGGCYQVSGFNDTICNDSWKPECRK